MKKFILASLAACLIAGAFSSASAYNGKQVNGKAVSVMWKVFGWEHAGDAACQCMESDFYNDGSIVLYTIANAAVTKADTIYHKINGPAAYPAFNLQGTKIAFYRESRAPDPSNPHNCISVNGGKSYMSVINSDGTGLSNLCELPTNPLGGESMPLDWPAGDWIYYVHVRVGTVQCISLWKVNCNTGATQAVCDNPTFGGQDMTCNKYRRFSLNLDGNRFATQVMPLDGCTPGSSYSCNSVFNFPPSNCNFSQAIASRAGCNISISPSGRLMGSYFAGSHDNLFINSVDLTENYQANVLLTDLQSWSGNFIGLGSEVIRWAVNSDKWALQEVGIYGHAAAMVRGSNQIACDWMDQVAINVSNHGATANNDGFTCLNNCTGDMWISDPANNPGGCRYEDLQGVWHDVAGCSPTDIIMSGNRAGRIEALSMIKGRELDLRLPAGNERAAVSVADTRGRTMMRFMACGPTHVSLQSLPAGTYLVNARSRTISYETTIMVR